MARIRTIKPEFPHSESMGRVSREARLTFIMLWTIADDSGRLRGNSRMLASLLYPYDDDSKDLIEGWISELEKEHCIVRYEVDSCAYIEIRKWLEHQKIDKPSKSKLPGFDEASRGFANVRRGISTRTRTKDQDQEKEKATSADAAASETEPAPTSETEPENPTPKIAAVAAGGGGGGKKKKSGKSKPIPQGLIPLDAEPWLDKTRAEYPRHAPDGRPIHQGTRAELAQLWAGIMRDRPDVTPRELRACARLLVGSQETAETPWRYSLTTVFGPKKAPWLDHLDAARTRIASTSAAIQETAS